MKRFSRCFSALVATLFLFAGNALAAMPTDVDLTEVITYGGVIVAALVGLIVIRKAIKLTNRS